LSRGGGPETDRTKRILVGLLVAYAASMTLIASQRAADAWLYRRCFDLLYRGKHGGRPGHYPSLMSLAADFGLNLSQVEVWFLRVADLRSVFLYPILASIVLGCLGVAAWQGDLSPRLDDR
jgi:hypothetical protein